MSLPPDHNGRVDRARLSLEGLSIGDAFGERFFRPPRVVESLVQRRTLPASPWLYTDDTVMALSIVEVLEEYGHIDQDALAASFAAKYARDPGRGYGGMAHHILQQICGGADWRDVSRAAFDGMGSMGNGAAMRVGPAGAYFADDFQLAADQARLSAEVTHAHLEGQAGAIAVAVAAAWAALGRNGHLARRGTDLLEAAADYTPDTHTRTGIVEAQSLPTTSSIETAVNALGNGSRVTSQDTVPFALWCAARHLDHYEEALWNTVSGLGDRDTTCAIVGGIVVLATGSQSLPGAWMQAREPLDTLSR